MLMLLRILMPLCLLAFFAGAVHAAPEGERFTTMQWRMSLDAEGRVTALVAKGDHIEALRERTEQAIRMWEFVPGTVDGMPAATDTLLSVQAVLKPSADDGQYTVVLRDVRTGGHVVDGATRAPRFPQSELRRMAARGVKFAQVAVEVGYDASGKAIALQVAEGSRTQPEELVKAVIKALREWTYEPERVAGVGVPGTLVVPICFTLAQSPTEARKLSNACRWTLPGSNAYVDDGQSLALDSQVRLKTDVAGSIL